MSDVHFIDISLKKKKEENWKEVQYGRLLLLKTLRITVPKLNGLFLKWTANWPVFDICIRLKSGNLHVLFEGVQR